MKDVKTNHHNQINSNNQKILNSHYYSGSTSSRTTPWRVWGWSRRNGWSWSSQTSRGDTWRTLFTKVVLTPLTSHLSPLTSHYVLFVRFTASLDHLAEHWRPATDTYRLAQSTQEQGSLLRQEGSCASAGQGEGAPQPHDLWRHPPQLPGALLCPGGGGDGAHTEERGQHVKVPSVHFWW